MQNAVRYPRYSLLMLGACAVEICDNRDGMFMEV